MSSFDGPLVQARSPFLEVHYSAAVEMVNIKQKHVACPMAVAVAILRYFPYSIWSRHMNDFPPRKYPAV